MAILHRLSPLFLLAAMFGFAGAPPVMAQQFDSLAKPSLTWTPVRGKANDIGIGAGGDVVAAGKDENVWRWDRAGSRWRKMSGKLIRVTVAPDGRPWGVAADGRIYRRNGLWWDKLNKTAHDIAVGADGSVYSVGLDGTLAAWEPFGKRWRRIPGRKGLRVAVSPKGVPWVVGPDGSISYFENGDWTDVPGKALDIAIGPDGEAVIVSPEGDLRKWDEDGQSWAVLDGTAEALSVAVGPGGFPWYVTREGKVLAASFFPLAEETTTSRARPRERGGADPVAITSDEPLVFARVNGTASQLAIGADGSIFALDVDGALTRWSNARNRFLAFPGTVTRIAVAPDGRPWGINSRREIFRHDGQDWKNVRGKADEIAIGADGTVIISDSSEFLFRLNDSMTRFNRIPGARGSKIAVLPDGVPVTIRSNGRIFRCDANPCTRLNRLGRDIAAGPDGSLFMVTQERRLFRFDADIEDWVRVTTGRPVVDVAVGPRGLPWIIDDKNRVFAAALFERDESGDFAIAQATTQPTVVTSIFTPSTAPTSIFTFTKNIKFEEITVPQTGSPQFGNALSAIGIGIDGAVYVLGDFGDKLKEFNAKTETFSDVTFSVPDSINQLAADADGRIWFASNTEDKIFRQKKKGGSSFNSFTLSSSSSSARDVAIGGDGTVFAVGSNNNLYKFDDSKNRFELFDNGSFSDVAVSPDGIPWVIEQSSQEVKAYDGTKFVEPGKKTQTGFDIAIGASGATFVAAGSSNKIVKWNATNQDFDELTVSGSDVAVEPDGRPWYLNVSSSDNAFRAK